jgi:hypothetical protein
VRLQKRHVYALAGQEQREDGASRSSSHHAAGRALYIEYLIFHLQLLDVLSCWVHVGSH